MEKIRPSIGDTLNYRRVKKATDRLCDFAPVARSSQGAGSSNIILSIFDMSVHSKVNFVGLFVTLSVREGVRIFRRW